MHPASCPRGEGEAVLFPRRGHCGPGKVRCRPCTSTTRSTLQRRAHKGTAPSHGSRGPPAGTGTRRGRPWTPLTGTAWLPAPIPFSSTGANHRALHNIRGCRLGPPRRASPHSVIYRAAQAQLADVDPIHVCMMRASVPGIKRPAP
jgi:hypothetical protein